MAVLRFVPTVNIDTVHYWWSFATVKSEHRLVSRQRTLSLADRRMRNWPGRGVAFFVLLLLKGKSKAREDMSLSGRVCPVTEVGKVIDEVEGEKPNHVGRKRTTYLVSALLACMLLCSIMRAFCLWDGSGG